MTLAPGTRVGVYDIDSLLGAGGMGEVYRARDTRLQRSVAIKILPATFAADQERLARFEREAQVLASLNHPNIAQIYGVEETGGGLALVMELVDGPTLSEVIAQRGPQRKAASSATGAWDVDPLAIARQLADALEAAHDQNIIHRDLKPQNIILRPDGTVKVLDFGLAKALDPVIGGASDNSPTITNAATRVGTLLGTAAYMAPEQVKGRPADRRSDIWAFGAVLYELWTGVMPFTGDSVTEILARVIERDPDWSKLPPDTPPAVTRLLHRALVKDSRRRLQSIGDARFDLDEASSPIPAPAPVASPSPGISRWWTLGLALVVCAAGGVAAGRWMRPAATIAGAPPIRASIALPPGLFLDGGGPPEMAFSPDGRMLAFLARGATGFQRLYVRELGSDTATLVPDSETAEGPIFSPDGRWVAFAVGVSVIATSRPELRKYSLDTGLTQTISPVVDYFGGLWLDDGTIVFVNQQPAGLWSVNSAGGEPRQLAAKWILDGQEVERALAWPSLVPGTRTVVLTEWGASRVGHLVVADLDTRRLVKLGIEGTGGQVLPNGYLVYANPSAALMAVRFDVANRRTSGTPVALMPEIALGRNNAAVFATAGNGTLAFAPGYLRWSRREPMQVVKISPSGKAEPLTFEPDLFFRGFEISPDGSRLAIGTWDNHKSILDLRRGTRQKFSDRSILEIYSLSWRPDGRTLAAGGQLAGSSAWGIVVDPLDGSRNDPIISEPLREVFTAGWLPGGRTHIAWTSLANGSAIVRKDDDQPPQPILAIRGFVRTVRISPDGRWLAFDTNEGGPTHVYVVSISGKGERVAVSPRPGESPRWSHDGRQLFFRSGTAMMAVDVHETGEQIELGAERKLFDAEMASEYAVGPSGDFYTLAPVPGAAMQTHIQLRTRWFDEVDRLMRGSERRP
jgi:eukaryotic-like serine/threonine-protein kinase